MSVDELAVPIFLTQKRTRPTPDLMLVRIIIDGLRYHNYLEAVEPHVPVLEWGKEGKALHIWSELADVSLLEVLQVLGNSKKLDTSKQDCQQSRDVRKAPRA